MDAHGSGGVSLGLLTRYGLTLASASSEEHVGYETIGATTSFNNTNQAGYEFTVGAADITVTALRGYARATGTDYTLRLWRVSDEENLASIDHVSLTESEWGEAELSSAITLAAGANYIVTIRGGSAMWRDTDIASAVFNDAITFVAGRRVTNNTFPSTVVADEPRGLADIKFTT